MKFQRFFTKENIHPFEEVNWIRTTSRITDKNGNIIFEQKDVEFPSFWEQTSIDIVCEKYFKGAINSSDREYSLKQLITRIVDWYYQKGLDDGYFDTKKDAEIFRDELSYILLHQYAAFNSPVYFNVGVKENPQVSACFILSAEDSMNSISDTMKIEMDIFRGGSGAGINRSKLRSTKEKVSTGGTAMGPLIPMQISDKIAKATKSGGKTRRSALMMELDIDHGDIERFITQKAVIERAAKILIKEGWSADFDDPDGVYSLLGLQNFNESVSIPDEFMSCLSFQQDWALLERYPTSLPENFFKEEEKTTFQGEFFRFQDNWYLLKDSSYIKVLKWVKSSYLWDLICESAWECADPGIQYSTTINKWHTCKKDGPITGSNPCSEYFFLEDTSCNLASLNLLKFNKDEQFDIEAFSNVIRVFITAMDISVHNASYPTRKIKEKTIKYRTLGLGYTNLGALLLRKLLPYDSDEGRYYAASITSLLLAFSYKTSYEIASDPKFGPFARYEANKDSVKEVLSLHRQSIVSLLEKIKKVSDSALQQELFNLVNTAQQSFPESDLIRNAQVVVIAPTGTISFMMGAETTGVEPAIGLTYYKKMVGGGFIELSIPSVRIALKKLNYTEREIDLFFKFLKESPDLIFSIINPSHIPLLQTSFSSIKELTISPEAHVKMMAEIQPFISGAISKTVNLPEYFTKKDIGEIFKLAWKEGIKSISVYRDNSKGSQPLFLTKDGKVMVNGRPRPIRKELPINRPGYNHKFRLGNQTGFLQFGFYPDTKELGEMYAEISKAGSTLNGLVNTIAISVSMMLQHGIDPQQIIEAYENLQFSPNGFTNNPDIPTASSIPDYIAKYIRYLISNNPYKKELQNNKFSKTTEVSHSSDSGESCPTCGSLMVKTGTCYTCTNCGATGGCG